jgi:hypothetical protein
MSSGTRLAGFWKLTPRSTTRNHKPPLALSAQKTNAPSAPAYRHLESARLGPGRAWWGWRLVAEDRPANSR